jgi:hypothetical protein
MCGECDNVENFVSKTCIPDRIYPPCVFGHQSDPLDIAHNQADDNHDQALLDCQIEMNTNQSIQTVNVVHQYAQTDIIDSDSYLIDKVSNPLNQFCNFVEQAETALLDCQIEMNTNQSILPVNLDHQYGQMDIIDRISHSFNETNNFVQEVETVGLECDSKQVEMNKNQTFQPVNLVHECGQMAIIDSESNQSIFENQSKSEMQESMLFMVHCDTVAYKARHWMQLLLQQLNDTKQSISFLGSIVRSQGWIIV